MCFKFCFYTFRTRIIEKALNKCWEPPCSPTLKIVGPGGRDLGSINIFITVALLLRDPCIHFEYHKKLVPTSIGFINVNLKCLVRSLREQSNTFTSAGTLENRSDEQLICSLLYSRYVKIGNRVSDCSNVFWIIY